MEKEFGTCPKAGICTCRISHPKRQSKQCKADSYLWDNGEKIKNPKRKKYWSK